MTNIIALHLAALVGVNATGFMKLIPVALILLTCFAIVLKRPTIGLPELIISAFFVVVILLKFAFQGGGFDGAEVGFEAISPIALIPTILIMRSMKEHLSYSLNRENVAKFVSVILMLVLIIDLGLRIYKNGFLFYTDTHYTVGKFGGLFPTSNVAGYIAFIGYFLCEISRMSKISHFIMFLLLLMSLSRVALVAFFVTLLARVFLGGTVKQRVAYLLTSGVFFLLVFDSYLSSGSLQSKIDLTLHFFKIYGGLVDASILWGQPLNPGEIRTESINNWSPHVSFLKAFVYFGLIGLIVWIAMHGYFLLKSRGKEYVLGGIVLGLAGTPIIWPGFIVILAFSQSNPLNARSQRVNF